MHPILKAITAAVLVVVGIASAGAEPFPSKPIKIVSPFPPGGANDIVARVLAQRLSDSLGRAVVVENRPGAAGSIGSEMVAMSAPDGYTLVMGTLATHGINSLINKSLPYDPVRDFTPITLVARIPIVLEANPVLGVKNLKDLIRLAKAEPGKLNFASSGVGSVNHLSGELFKSLAGVDIVHVGYKGSAPALNDVLGGHVKLMFDLLPSSLPYISSGKLTALAVTSAERTSLLPDVPTMAEAGLPNYEANSWFGILGPAGLPKAVVDTLNEKIVDALKSPEVRRVLSQQGAEPIPSTSEQFKQTIETDLARWRPIVGSLHLTGR
jgi:tripartite-type tricarboxylate transporter receptor subunit TctC